MNMKVENNNDVSLNNNDNDMKEIADDLAFIPYDNDVMAVKTPTRKHYNVVLDAIDKVDGLSIDSKGTTPEQDAFGGVFVEYDSNLDLSLLLREIKF